MDASVDNGLSTCTSTYRVAADLALECTQHLGTPERIKHSARYMGVRWYWTDEESERSMNARSFR